MSRFQPYREHKAEECEALSNEYGTYSVPQPVKGQDYHAPVRTASTRGGVVVEAASAEAAAASLPPLNRAHTKACQVESMRF